MISQEYTIFTGCSHTEGIGLSNTICNKNLWVNVLYNSSEKLLRTKLVNLGVGGSSNIEIFQRSINALASYNCKYLFVSWTSLYRYKFSLGAELYDVSQYWAPGQSLNDVNLNPSLTYSKKYLTNIKDKFFALHHDHCEIVKVLNYTATINHIGQKLGVKIYFINNILPWDVGYFNPVTDKDRVPSDVTAYTQDLLSARTRDDEEFFKIYDNVHRDYASTQGILNCSWINLDVGFRNQFLLDLGNDNKHPGELSHRQFGTFLSESFNKIMSSK
jgi:hypothetical protein